MKECGDTFGLTDVKRNAKIPDLASVKQKMSSAKMKACSLFPWCFRKRCMLFPPHTNLIYLLQLSFCKDGHVSTFIYVSTQHLLFHWYRVTPGSWMAHKCTYVEVWTMMWECPSHWIDFPALGSNFPAFLHPAVRRKGQQCIILFLLSWDSGHCWVTPWCLSKLLGGQQTIPYCRTVPFLSLSPTLLFSIPQLPRGLEMFQE